ncbi:MAG: O-antigen ligase family protein [Thermomicrobiales bacterium]
MALAAWIGFVVCGMLLSTRLPTSLAVALVAGGVVFAAISPVGATAAILSAIPFVYDAIPIGSFDVSPLELAIVVGSAGLALRASGALLHRDLRGFISDTLRPLPLTLAAAGLALVAVLSLLYVADPRHLDESLLELRKTILEPIAALVLIRWAVRNNGLPLLITALATGGAVAALMGGGQVVSQSGGVLGDETYRARGPYPHPNNLALYLERIVMLLGGIALMSATARRKALPIAAVLIVGLALTFSRGALLGIAAGGATLLMFKRPPRGWVYYALGLGGAIAAFAAIAGGRLFATGAEGATSSRELLWRSSLRMAADHPITGVGLDQFLYQYGRRYVDPAGWPERYTSHPHNLLLDVWLRLGVAGIVAFAVIILVSVQLVQHARLREDLSGAAAAGAIAALVAGIAHGLVDNSFFLPDLAVLTWCFLAFVEHDAPKLRERRAWRPLWLSRSALT